MLYVVPFKCIFLGLPLTLRSHDQFQPVFFNLNFFLANSHNGGGSATVRIGREILCLPYAGFFFLFSFLFLSFSKLALIPLSYLFKFINFEAYILLKFCIIFNFCFFQRQLPSRLFFTRQSVCNYTIDCLTCDP